MFVIKVNSLSLKFSKGTYKYGDRVTLTKEEFDSVEVQDILKTKRALYINRNRRRKAPVTGFLRPEVKYVNQNEQAIQAADLVKSVVDAIRLASASAQPPKVTLNQDNSNLEGLLQQLIDSNQGIATQLENLPAAEVKIVSGPTQDIHTGTMAPKKEFIPSVGKEEVKASNIKVKSDSKESSAADAAAALAAFKKKE